MTQQQIVDAGTQAMAEARRLWSVTTLIKAGLGAGEQLIDWASKVTAWRAYDDIEILTAYHNKGQRKDAIYWLKGARFEKRRVAMAEGSEVHKIIEAYAYGRKPEIDDVTAPYDVQIRKFLEDHNPTFEAAEAPVYNLRYGYAGTMDLILVIGGKRVIVDAKTTDKDPNDPETRSMPPYAEVALQLVAYARAERIGTSPANMRTFNRRRYYVYDPDLGYEPMPALDGAMALAVSPYNYRLVPVAIDDEVWAMFGHVREAARWQLSLSQRVLGPDVTPPPKEA